MRNYLWIMITLCLCSCSNATETNQAIGQKDRQDKQSTIVQLENSVFSQLENIAITGSAVQEEANEKEQITSALTGKIICIDAGHQQNGSSKQEAVGPGSSETKARVSSGTRGVATGKYEYELNLEVALKLKTALEEKGAVVHMVRETNDVNISNKERAELANTVNADLSLRLHADGSDNSSARGFSVLVPSGQYVSDTVISESYAIAEDIEQYLSQGVPIKSRGIVRRSDLTGFNWSTVPAVLVEMGFMSNPEEDKLLSSEDFQETFVTALVKGLEAYYL